MFSGTIMENSRIQPEKRDFARKMSQLLGLETTINLLPDGYETELGRELATTCDVYRQQVNIVRALTNRPRVLALDEPICLDAVASRVDTCARTLRGRLTVIVVNTVHPAGLCDRLILVEDGHATWLSAPTLRESGVMTIHSSVSPLSTHPGCRPGEIGQPVHASLAGLRRICRPSDANYLLGKLRSSRTLMTSSDLRRRELALPHAALFGWAGRPPNSRSSPHFDRVESIEALRLVLTFWLRSHSDRSGSRDSQ